MNNVGRVLLIVGLVVLAVLVGVLIGRGRRAQPTAAGDAQAVQITTAPPPALTPPPPLPAPVQTPQPAAIPKLAPDAQIEEDAAAVGMTTREPADQDTGTMDAGATAPHKAAAGPDSAPPPGQPQG